MNTEPQTIALADLKVADSRYRPPGRPVDGTTNRLTDSLRQLGQLTPLLAQRHGDGTVHLMDGFARVAAARTLGWPSLQARLLEPTLPAEERVALLAVIRSADLADSVVARAQLLQLGHELGVPHARLRDRILPLLGWEPHERVLRRCLAVAALPQEVLDFCRAKHFSFKQCVHLTHHPSALLAQVFGWRDRLTLSASILSELLEQLRDYLRSAGLRASDVADVGEIRAILDSDGTPQERTQRLRAAVRALRFPLLSATNAELATLRDALSLPATVEMRWDPTLEQRAVELHLRVRSAAEWCRTRDALAEGAIEHGIDRMLECL